MTFGDEIIDGPSWRMYFLYFGMSSLAIGSGLFSFCCPNEVKEHGSAYDLVIKQAAIVNESRQERMIDHLIKWHEARSGQAYIEEYFRTKKLRRELIMTEYFEMLEEQNFIARVATAASYAIGAAIVAVPTMITFFRIAWEIIV